MKVVVVTGNIGAGKTTFLRHIAALADANTNPNVFVIYEGVEKWAYYLKKFYEDPKKNDSAFLFHGDVFAHYHAVTKSLHQVFETNPNAIIFVERSPHDVLHIFLQKVGEYLSPAQWNGLRLTFLALTEVDVWKLAESIYIDTPARLCHQRKEKRSREGEAPIDANYLEQIEALYRGSWMMQSSIHTVTNDGQYDTLQDAAKKFLEQHAQ